MPRRSHDLSGRRKISFAPVCQERISHSHPVFLNTSILPVLILSWTAYRYSVRASEWERSWQQKSSGCGLNHDIDVVIPIPDSSRTSALETAYMLDIKYREGFVKNRYVGRTFIMPGQAQRKKSVKQKLNAISWRV